MVNNQMLRCKHGRIELAGLTTFRRGITAPGCAANIGGEADRFFWARTVQTVQSFSLQQTASRIKTLNDAVQLVLPGSDSGGLRASIYCISFIRAYASLCTAGVSWQVLNEHKRHAAALCWSARCLRFHMQYPYNSMRYCGRSSRPEQCLIWIYLRSH